ncbi:MAG: hypothetical protein AMJ46_08520 [Latescibacteria bacterium DG_63]|nr:MAG: hypothetical protein AMJ46_08520 [Latescibacteria bacterium DG_63]
MEKSTATRIALIVLLASVISCLPVHGGAAAEPVPGRVQPDVERTPPSSPVPTLERRGDVYVSSEIKVEGERPSLPFSILLDEHMAKRTPATFSDPLRAALWTVPGVSPRDEFFVRPSVHGGLPDWVSVYYGDFPDCYPYMLYGAVSVANAQFDELRLLKGAFPVEYGDALSGVMVIEPKRLAATGTSAGVSMDLLRSSFHVSGPLKDWDYGLSCETSFYDKVLSAFDEGGYPNSSSVLSSISRRFGSRRLFLRAFYGSGGADTRVEPSTDTYTSTNAASRTLKRRFELSVQDAGTKTLHTTSVGFFSDAESFDASDGLMGRNKDVLSVFSADVVLKAKSFGLSHKSTLYSPGGHAVDIGGSVRNEEVSQYARTQGWDFIPLFNTGRDDLTDESLSDLDEVLRFWRYSLYAQHRRRLGGFRVTVGARCDALNSSAVPAMRASVERKLSILNLRVAGGQYHRFPVSGTLREGKLAGLTETYWEPESAIHALFGVDAMFGLATVSVDLHRQRYCHLVLVSPEGFESRGGTGELRSVDLTVSSPKGSRRFWAYATASLGRAEVMGIPTDWDQRLVGKAVCSARISRTLELASRVFYGSGLAYTPLVGRRLVISAEEPLTDIGGNAVYEAVWGPENSARLPYQFRLDVRLTMDVTPFGKKTRFYVEGFNLTNHKNVSGISYLDYYSRTVYRSNLPRAANVGFEFYF